MHEQHIPDPLTEQDSAEISKQTEWHLVVADWQSEILTPVEVEVTTEVPASLKLPKIDILLLRRKGTAWTQAQMARLPDGIRQSSASHIICEFKYTQSVNRSTMVQALMYDELYRQSRKLKRHQVATFVISARTPKPAVLAQFGYAATELKGVYRSQQVIVEPITLIVLNELSSEPHNAFFKLFASQHKVREASFELLNEMKVGNWSQEIHIVYSGLHMLFQKREGGMMKSTGITPEYVRKLGRDVQQAILDTMPAEYVERLTPAQRLEGLDPKQVLEVIDTKQMLEVMDPAVIEAFIQVRKQAEKPTPSTPKSSVRRKSRRKDEKTTDPTRVSSAVGA